MTITWTAKPSDVERVVAAVLPYASADSTLPVINCVRIELEKDTFLAVATDRYSLGVCRASLSEWDSDAKKVRKAVAHLRVPDVKRLFAFLKASRALTATWKLAEDALTVETADGESLRVRTMPDETAFPDWRVLVNRSAEATATEVMGFSPAIVDHFHKTAKVLGDPRYTWRLGGALKPALIHIGESFVGMIMPVRLPDYLALDLAPFGIKAPKVVTAA